MATLNKRNELILYQENSTYFIDVFIIENVRVRLIENG